MVESAQKENRFYLDTNNELQSIMEMLTIEMNKNRPKDIVSFFSNNILQPSFLLNVVKDQYGERATSINLYLTI